ncbi:MAG TPA: DUF4263 domain-containing protein [bacterium]|nr:DUF4263 domain-containing protein [bacterium]
MKTKIITLSSDVVEKADLLEYEKMILDNKNISEHNASKFFAKFPKFLSIGGYKEFAREIVLSTPQNEQMYRVDFCRKRYGTLYWDIVELKRPGIQALVKKGKHWHFSDAVQKGIDQSYDYRNLMHDKTNMELTENKTGIRIYRPKILLIAGRKDNDIGEDELIDLIDKYNHFEFLTYDDLFNSHTEHYKSTLIVVPVFEGDDIPIEDSGVQLKRHIQEMLVVLTNKERRVLELRFGLIDGIPRDCETIAESMNENPSNIRKIESKALRKLRFPPTTRL